MLFWGNLANLVAPNSTQNIMSKSSQLANILLQKGWDVKVWYEPVSDNLWGSDGGYCLEIHNNGTDQLKGFHCHWLGYDFDSALKEANRYPKNSMYEGLDYDPNQKTWFDPKSIQLCATEESAV